MPLPPHIDKYTLVAFQYGMGTLSRRFSSHFETFCFRLIIIRPYTMNETESTTKEVRPDTTPGPKRVSGIYKIVNKIDGKYYIGSSCNITAPSLGRWYAHKRVLRINKHWNSKLQNAWNKYGEENFEFLILENCSDDGPTLLLNEQKYLDIAKMNKKQCYNITFTAGKIDMTDEVLEKMSLAKKGKYVGNKNHQFKQVNDTIFNESKQVWINDGENKLTIFLKEKYDLGGCVADRLVKEFNKDEKSLAKRKQNQRDLAKHLYFTHYVRYGSKNPRYNPEIFYLKRLITHEEFVGTRVEFFKRYGTRLPSKFATGETKSFKKWKIVYSF